MNALKKAFQRIPLLKDYQPADFKIQRLPGLTNHSFHLQNLENDWVLRIPKADTNVHIDRKAEAFNNNIAMQLGLAPSCLWRDDSGLSLTTTLRHTQSPTAQDLCHPEILNPILQQLKILHTSKQRFHGCVNLKVLLQRYFGLIPDAQKPLLSNDFSSAVQRLNIIQQKDRTLTPSHNDLILQNLLIDASSKVWFIDWEYSSMASPYWDLATLCNAADFNLEQSVNLLHLYNAKLKAQEIDLLIEYRFILQVLTECWMMAFHSAENISTSTLHTEKPS